MSQPPPPAIGNLLLRTPRFDVRELYMTPQHDRAHMRAVVVHPGAVVILPLLDDGRVAMIRNRRPTVGCILWELPAGTLEPPEPPTACAARELIEETGYQAALLTPLATFYTCPGICTELMYGFVARGLKHVGQQLEATEQIDVEPVAMEKALAMVRDGEIQDGKTMTMLLHYNAFGHAGAKGESV